MARLMATARTLSRLAARRKPRRAGRARLPPLFLLTDPARTPDPVALAQRLPRGCGVIYRAFGAADAPRTADALAAVAVRRGLILLIGADAVRAPGAGVHLPERMARQAGRLKRSRPDVLVTAAAHSRIAIRRARLAGVDAVLVSAVFPSRSPSAGRPIGPTRFAALVRDAGLPVYALGGINDKTAQRLLGSGAAGLAAVEAFQGF